MIYSQMSTHKRANDTSYNHWKYDSITKKINIGVYCLNFGYSIEYRAFGIENVKQGIEKESYRD